MYREQKHNIVYSQSESSTLSATNLVHNHPAQHIHIMTINPQSFMRFPLIIVVPCGVLRNVKAF
jgi:hypothetical protein